MRGVQRFECKPQPWGVEMGVHSNIKADRAAITRRRIYPPHLSIGFSNGHAGQLLRKSRGILTVLQLSLLGSFPQGRREDIAGLRIQIAAKGVNSFGKSMRRQTASQPESEQIAMAPICRSTIRASDQGPDALIAISTRPAGRRPPNNMALATVSVSRSSTELGVTPRPRSALRARAALDKIVSSDRWWPDRLPSTGLRQCAARRRT